MGGTEQDQVQMHTIRRSFVHGKAVKMDVFPRGAELLVNHDLRIDRCGALLAQPAHWVRGASAAPLTSPPRALCRVRYAKTLFFGS